MTKAKTEKSISWNSSSLGRRREELTDITADAVKPVRTVRFAVMNLFSELVLKEDLGRNLRTFLSFRCPLR